MPGLKQFSMMGIEKDNWSLLLETLESLFDDVYEQIGNIKGIENRDSLFTSIKTVQLTVTSQLKIASLLTSGLAGIATDQSVVSVPLDLGLQFTSGNKLQIKQQAHLAQITTTYNTGFPSVDTALTELKNKINNILTRAEGAEWLAAS